MEKTPPTNSPFDRLDSRVYGQMLGLALDFQHNWGQFEQDLRFELRNGNEFIAEILEIAADEVGQGFECPGFGIRQRDITDAYVLGGEIAYKALSIQSRYRLMMPRLGSHQQLKFCDSLEGYSSTPVKSFAANRSSQHWMLGEKTYREDPRFSELVMDLSSIAVERRYVPFFQAGAGLVRLAVRYADEVPDLEETFSLRGFRHRRKFRF